MYLYHVVSSGTYFCSWLDLGYSVYIFISIYIHIYIYIYIYHMYIYIYIRMCVAACCVLEGKN